MAKTLTQDQIDDLLKAIHHEPDEEEYTIKKVPSSPKIENLEIQKLKDEYENRIIELETKYENFYKRLQKIVYN